jgi:tetratricopeptide (TPR) repeat protein
MRFNRLSVLALACLTWSGSLFAKHPVEQASRKTSIISSATALHDLMAAELFAQEHAYSAASRLYFPYGVSSAYSDITERATTLAFLSGDLALSARLAKHWLKLKPHDRTAYQILLTAQVNAEHYREAHQTLARYLNSESAEKSKSAEPLFPIIKALFQHNEEDLATQRWVRFIESSPSRSVRYRLELALGAVLLDAKDPTNVERGLRALENAMATEPMAIEPAVHYALLLSKEEPDKAGTWLNQAIIKRQPTEAHYLMAGFILSARQQLAFSEPVFKEAVGRYPKNLVFATLYLQSLLENRSYVEAQKRLVDLLGLLDPKEPRTTQMAIQLIRLAHTPEEQEKAVYFLKHVPVNDEYYEAVQEVILYQLSELNPQQAVEHLEQLYTQKLSFTLPPVWWLFPAEALQKKKQLKEGLAVIEKGLNRHPDSEDLLEGKAMFFTDMGRLQEAEDIWRDLIQRYPDQHSFYNNLGYVLLDKENRIREADPLIRKAYALTPTDAAVLDSMGWLHFKLNQPKAALPYLEEALKHGTAKDPEILLHLVEVASALGEVDRVRQGLTDIERQKTKEWEPLIALKKRLGLK